MGMMDGLLGNSIDDPRTTALMAGIQGLLGGRGLMQGISGGLLARNDSMQQSKRQEQMQAMQAMQMQMQQENMKQAQMQRAAQERQQQFLGGLQSPQQQAIGGALAGGGGPTMGNAANIAPVDPNQQMMFEGMKAGVIPFASYLAAQQKDTTPINVAAGGALFDPRTKQLLFQNPKEDSTPSAIKEYNFAKGQGYGGTFQQFQLDQKRAGATNISLPKIDIKTGEGIAGQVGPMIKESYTAASGAIQTANAANNVISAIDSGKIIAGTFANGRLAIAQVGDLLGVGGADNAAKIANTRAAINGLSNMTLQGRKQMSGQGAITESESKLAERAVSGDINFTSAEIKQLANAAKRASKFTFDQHQRQISNMQQSPEMVGLSRFYQTAPWPTDAGAPPAAPSPDDLVNKYRSR